MSRRETGLLRGILCLNMGLCTPIPHVSSFLRELAGIWTAGARATVDRGAKAGRERVSEGARNLFRRGGSFPVAIDITVSVLRLSVAVVGKKRVGAGTDAREAVGAHVHYRSRKSG